MNETQGHFKFIKRAKDWLDPGDYLPDFAGIPVHNGIKLDPRPRSCLFLFFIDTECEPCGDGLNTLYKMLSEYDLPVTILVSTPDKDKFEVLKDAFDGMADVYRYSLKEMRAHFRTGRPLGIRHKLRRPDHHQFGLRQPGRISPIGAPVSMSDR